VNPNILVAGDHFVLNSLLIKALHAALPNIPSFRELELPWPDVPFGRVAEVDEASGTEEMMIEALRGIEICVTQMAPLTEKVLAASPDLKLFVVTRGGPVNANISAATRHGVSVCFTPGRNAAAAAEHTVGLLLATLRRIPETQQALFAGEWQGTYYRYEHSGLELENATVGLVGSGAIGMRVARILNAFGCHVLVYDPYVSSEALTGIAEKVELEELLARSRIVSLHARATPETQRMIGAQQIAQMPAGSIIINCARGSLLDYDAVCDAIEAGHLLGAGFDVFPEEPIPPSSRLLRTPSIVLTPHIAGASRETAEKAALLAAAEVERYLRKEPFKHRANPGLTSQS
jgi:D-3-phosphoglycerate dehydrogenase / 2-oxoglutarate reductase